MPLKLPGWRSNSVSRKLLAWILVVSSIVTSILTGLQLGLEYNQDLDALESNIDLVQQGYSKSITASLWEMHNSQLKSQIDGILSVPGIQYVRILDKQRVIVEAGQAPLGKTISRSVPLAREEKGALSQIGVLEIHGNLDQVIKKLYKKVLVIFVTQFVKTLIVSFIIYLVIQRLLTRHLIKISNYLKVLNFDTVRANLFLNRSENNSAIPSIFRQDEQKDELDILVDSINDMQSKIHQSYHELNRLNQRLEAKVEEKTSLIIEQRQKLEYAAKMSSLGEMAGGIAHEINTPLATMAVNLDLLLGTLEKGEFRRELFQSILETNQSTVSRIAQIIQGLRTFSRDASNEPFVSISAHELIHGTVLLCQEKFKHAAIEFQVGDISRDATISCRSTEIRQVLLNLLNNAFDAILSLDQRWIRIDFTCDEKEYRISITDSGTGLPALVQEKMFLPFFSTKDVGKGTGMGLSISQGIVENHGGTLSYDPSHPNTRFTIVIPHKSPQGLRS